MNCVKYSSYKKLKNSLTNEEKNELTQWEVELFTKMTRVCSELLYTVNYYCIYIAY